MEALKISPRDEAGNVALMETLKHLYEVLLGHDRIQLQGMITEFEAAMDAQEPLGDWDFVSLLIGVNNQYRGRSVDDYLGEFTRLLQRAIALAGDRAGRALVLSIPDWGVTPFAFAGGRDARAIADDLDAYNAAAREACTAHGVAFVDITAISRDDGDATAMLADDGLHPSAAQYARWTDAALPVAIGLLGDEKGSE